MGEKCSTYFEDERSSEKSRHLVQFQTCVLIVISSLTSAGASGLLTIGHPLLLAG